LLAERSHATFSIPVRDILDDGADTVVVFATHSAQRAARRPPARHAGGSGLGFTDGKATSHDSFVSDVFEHDAFWS
jgi:hypothetical protein